jgi:ribosome-associated toxin RatA of RatAB toxin-antitoxin module
MNVSGGSRFAAAALPPVCMKTVNKSVLIWYSPQEMFDLVADVPRYPDFLPWCDHARVLEQHADGVTAEVGIALAGIKKSFVTRNTYEPGKRLQMALVKGPFSQLQGDWRFEPVGDGSQRACKVSLSLSYGFDSMALAAVVGPIFDKIAATMMDAFIQRAEKIYG